jgi:trimeric autotransporter adhesin
MIRPFSVVLALGAFLISCSSEPLSLDSPGVSFSIVSGNQQTGAAGAELPQPLVVRATDPSGKALRGALVNFRVTSGGGRMFAGTAISDGKGTAQDYWTLGPSIGVQTVDVVAVDPTTGAKEIFASFTAVGTGVAVSIALSPDPLNLAVGSFGLLTATLSPTPTANGTLTVSSDFAAATVPGSVSFITGQNSVNVPVTGVAPGTAHISVSLNGTTTTSTVQVFASPLTLSPAALSQQAGTTGLLSVALSSPALSDTQIQLAATGQVSVQPSVTVLAGQTGAEFNFTAGNVGTGQITATLGAASVSSTITVTP